MSANYLRQLESEFTSLLKPDETIAALGIFKKDPAISRILLTRGIARYAAMEFHAAVTNQRLIVLAVHFIRGEKVLSSPLEAGISEFKSPGTFSTRPSWWFPLSPLKNRSLFALNPGWRSLA